MVTSKRATAVLGVSLVLGVVPAWGSGPASAASKQTKRPPTHHAKAAARHHAKKPPTVKEAGKHYLAIVAAANAAITQVGQTVSADSPTTSFTTLGQQVAPLTAALEKLDQELTTYTWPSRARGDVRTLLSDDAQFIGALSSASGQNVLSGSSWLTTFESDATQLGTAANEVRHDLGLPPAK